MKKNQVREQLENCLLMVLENHQDELASESIDALTIAQMKLIIVWCQTMMYEASDNPVRARYAPKALRELLPPGHYLHTWRKPRRRHVRATP